MTPSYPSFGVLKIVIKMVDIARILMTSLREGSTNTHRLYSAFIMTPEILTKTLIAICWMSLMPIMRIM